MGIKCKESQLHIEMWNSENETDRVEGIVSIAPYVTEQEMLQKFEEWELKNNINILYFDRFTLTVE